MSTEDTVSYTHLGALLSSPFSWSRTSGPRSFTGSRGSSALIPSSLPSSSWFPCSAACGSATAGSPPSTRPASARLSLPLSLIHICPSRARSPLGTVAVRPFGTLGATGGPFGAFGALRPFGTFLRLVPRVVEISGVAGISGRIAFDGHGGVLVRGLSSRRDMKVP